MEKSQSYTNEFKSEAVKLVLNRGISERVAAKRLPVPKDTLSNWVRDAKGGKAVAASGARSVPELEAGRKNLAEARMERDILKKATAYFSQGISARYAFIKQWRSEFPAIESFWGSLKSELVHHRRYATRAEADASIREYIEIFYNCQRRRSRFGNLAPAVFAQKHRKQQRAA